MAETRRPSDLQIEVEREKRRKVEKVLKLLHRYCLLEMLDSCFGSLMNGCALEAGSLLIKNAFREMSDMEMNGLVRHNTRLGQASRY